MEEMWNIIKYLREYSEYFNSQKLLSSVMLDCVPVDFWAVIGIALFIGFISTMFVYIVEIL